MLLMIPLIKKIRQEKEENNLLRDILPSKILSKFIYLKIGIKKLCNQENYQILYNSQINKTRITLLKLQLF